LPLYSLGFVGEGVAARSVNMIKQRKNFIIKKLYLDDESTILLRKPLDF